MIPVDCGRYCETDPASFGGGASHEIKAYVENGNVEWAPYLLGSYLAGRSEVAWCRSRTG
jgi:hypothetical protein